ncbi:hypothetical protein LTR99_007138 [Exophiala xenobiotica]|uniref:Uncharacterized protein n=1 Tax=Vermiconidia calcicola TaxID=1690605 RepID=A0AAV9PTD5_9PEZI|nr:hypothetical protein LTR96_005400 [Exophiala xenobiotica]KAK5528930.1 hypothetical protein LTR25_010115 [Vermiconidia calcicola]KAK5544903.1 hypothetical protein LTR23_004032 [Chaetothyriales sp. CCFEE 6169]KAK5300389.1 hypothetical protein LTR99_007138 [Exophiala xenobiotica]KAK5334229.1 hypothetical protein LTR98_009692 [Exophiala xenobiotica]
MCRGHAKPSQLIVIRLTETTLLVFYQLTISAQPGVSPYWGDELLMEIFDHRQIIADLQARIETINTEEARVAAGGHGDDVLPPPPPAGNGGNGGNVSPPPRRAGNGNCGNVPTPPPPVGNGGNL